MHGGLFNGHSGWGPPEHLVQRFTVAGIYCLFIWGGAGTITIEIKCTKNVMHLNHPEPSPHPQVCGEFVFYKTGPSRQKGWELLI